MRVWISDGDRHKNVESGYGQNSVAIIAGLRERGHEVRFEAFPEADVCLFVCPPYSIRQIPIRPAVAYSVHELETLPPEKANWPEILNRLDLLLTATEWNRRNWQKLGVTIPIEVVPEGVDTDVYFPVTGRVCTFLCVHSNVGGGSSRERWRDTVQAYLESFDQRDRVRLVIKTWDWRPEQWERELGKLLSEVGIGSSEGPAIEVISNRLAGDEMRGLYHGAWLFLKNAEREGWSLPCTEAIACGRPIAATRIEPLLSILPSDTTWFDVGDVNALGTILRREYERFQASDEASTRYSARAMGRNSAVVLERLVQQGVWLSGWSESPIQAGGDHERG
jgi:glycosyltransferase involved in cell wall biosynthesis